MNNALKQVTYTYVVSISVYMLLSCIFLYISYA